MIVGDSNMSETTTLLKVGSTDLVLRMIEAGAIMRDLTLLSVAVAAVLVPLRAALHSRPVVGS